MVVSITAKIPVTVEDLGRALRQVAEGQAGGVLEIRDDGLWVLLPTPNGKWPKRVESQNRHIYDLFNAAAYLLDTPRVEVPNEPDR